MSKKKTKMPHYEIDDVDISWALCVPYGLEEFAEGSDEKMRARELREWGTGWKRPQLKQVLTSYMEGDGCCYCAIGCIESLIALNNYDEDFIDFVKDIISTEDFGEGHMVPFSYGDKEFLSDLEERIRARDKE